MKNADFSDRTYTAEVIKTKSEAADLLGAVFKLTHNPDVETITEPEIGKQIRIGHAYIASKREYHRFAKIITLQDGRQISIPREENIRGQKTFLYDVFIAQSQRHVVIAVPFHELAEEFFVRVDRVLAGSNTRYQKLDITKMVIRLGTSKSSDSPAIETEMAATLAITRCHLSYVDQKQRTTNLQQIRMTGTDLGNAKEYKNLVAPVLNPHNSDLTVTPVVLGFALSVNGVRKSSATTDRHGNFKLWIAPGLRRLIRLFNLLDILESMKDIALTTSNIPILQSKTIREAED